MKPRVAACAFALIAGLGSSAMSQEREWSLDAVEDDAFLVFGVPQTDDVGLSFWCKIGSGKISLFYPVTWMNLEDGEDREIRAVVGGREFKLMGKSAAGSESATASLEVTLPIQSEFIDTVTQSDRLMLTLDQHKGIYPLIGANFKSLLRLCRGA